MFPQSSFVLPAGEFPDLDFDTLTLDITPRDLAQRLGVSQRALRFYDEKKLMGLPRHGSGRTRYRPDEAIRLGFIVVCRRAGLGVRDIAAMLRAMDHAPHDLDILGIRLEEHLEEIEEQRLALAAQRHLVLSWLEQLGRPASICLMGQDRHGLKQT